jgi:hypothetical protein
MTELILRASEIQILENCPQLSGGQHHLFVEKNKNIQKEKPYHLQITRTKNNNRMT